MEESKHSSLLEKVYNMGELISYQDSSVVSRTLINKSAGTVTLFAFDKDQALSEHTAPYDALVYLIDGQANITISGIPHNVNEGETIIIPSNKPHALKAVSKFKMLLIMIKI